MPRVMFCRARVPRLRCRGSLPRLLLHPPHLIGGLTEGCMQCWVVAESETETPGVECILCAAMCGVAPGEKEGLLSKCAGGEGAVRHGVSDEAVNMWGRW